MPAPRTARIPVIFVTALNDTTDRVKAIEAGGDDFLTKPHNRQILSARVRSLLRLKFATDALDDHRPSEIAHHPVGSAEDRLPREVPGLPPRVLRGQRSPQCVDQADAFAEELLVERRVRLSSDGILPPDEQASRHNTDHSHGHGYPHLRLPVLPPSSGSIADRYEKSLA